MPEQADSETRDRGVIEPSKAEIRERIAEETRRRARLGVPAFAGGILYLLSAITLSATLKGIPTVGLLQGIAPAISGQPNPSVSPRAAEVRFYHDHSFALIAGAVIGALAIAALIVVLLFLFAAARFRRPQTSPVSRPLILVGGAAMAVLSVIGQIVLAIASHNFVNGHDFTTHAVEHALTKNTAYEVLGIFAPLTGLALVAGMITLMVSTVRVGLQPRWMGIVGGVGAVILVVPNQELSLILAFWMVGTGLLLMGRFPGGDPPAWAAGAARPWPSQLEARAQRDARRGGGDSKGSPTRGTSGQAVPEPVQPAGSSSRKRRKRGSRK